jgi:hypothetical protein
VEKVTEVVRNDSRFTVLKVTEELNMKEEPVRFIVIKYLNRRKIKYLNRRKPVLKFYRKVGLSGRKKYALTCQEDCYKNPIFNKK